MKAVIIPFFFICIIPFSLKGQNKYSVYINQPAKVEAPIINSVTVTKDNKNLITWEQAANENIEHFNIYRDATNVSDGWILIDRVPYKSKYLTEDISSFPNFRSYTYRVSTVDKCGNEFFSLRNHKTILLDFEETKENAFILKWNNYEGFDVDRYNIFKSEGGDTLQLSRSVPATTNLITDYDTGNDNVYYQAEAVSKIISTKSATGNEAARSNVISTRLALSLSDSANSTNIQVYPNPIIISAYVKFPFESNQYCSLTLFNLSGQPVLSGKVYSGEFELERGDLKDGFYILQVAGSTIYRKKILIGRL
ncbi:MAG: T9SS type A sorting domain-containing protein [Draconibacterium sp.]|nr:T9SS type A sorting domain-containing protein [Draconibacterium sp.]